MIAFVRYKNIPVISHHQPSRTIEQRRRVGAISTAGVCSRTGNGRHHPICANVCHFSDRAGRIIRHIYIATAIKSDAIRAIEQGAAVRAIGAAYGVGHACNGRPIVNLGPRHVARQRDHAQKSRTRHDAQKNYFSVFHKKFTAWLSQ